jgi:hypothetical protein
MGQKELVGFPRECIKTAATLQRQGISLRKITGLKTLPAASRPPLQADAGSRRKDYSRRAQSTGVARRTSVRT